MEMSKEGKDEKTRKRERLTAITGIGDKATIERLGPKEAAAGLIALERLRNNEDIARWINQGRDIVLDGPQLVAITLSNQEDMEAAHRIEPLLMGAFCCGQSAAGFLQKYNDLHMEFSSIASE